MSSDLHLVPEHIKKLFRSSVLEELHGLSSFDVFELELFDWYVRETEAVLQAMLAAEKQAVKEQYDAGGSSDEVNDSGIVAAEYYQKRVRFSHVIYLTSLLETFLEGECARLKAALGENNIPFGLKDLKGDQWSKRRKFLERYGSFQISKQLLPEVADLIALRNNIVHTNGTVSELLPDVLKRLSQRPGIGLASLSVQVEAEYIAKALSAVKAYCNDISAKVSSAIKRLIEVEDK